MTPTPALSRKVRPSSSSTTAAPVAWTSCSRRRRRSVEARSSSPTGRTWTAPPSSRTSTCSGSGIASRTVPSAGRRGAGVRRRARGRTPGSAWSGSTSASPSTATTACPVTRSTSARASSSSEARSSSRCERTSAARPRATRVRSAGVSVPSKSTVTCASVTWARARRGPVPERSRHSWTSPSAISLASCPRVRPGTGGGTADGVGGEVAIFRRGCTRPRPRHARHLRPAGAPGSRAGRRLRRRRQPCSRRGRRRRRRARPRPAASCADRHHAGQHERDAGELQPRRRLGEAAARRAGPSRRAGSSAAASPARRAAGGATWR